MQEEISVPFYLHHGMQDCTGVVGKSGFTSSLVGTQGSWKLTVGPPVEFSWHDSSLAGMGREASVLLVAVMGDYSLVLARDYSIVLVGVHSVVPGF